MNYLTQNSIPMSLLALLVENGVLALAVILGFTVDWVIPFAVIPAMVAVGLFVVWKKK